MCNVEILPFAPEHLNDVFMLEQEIFPDEPWSLQSFQAEFSSPFSLDLAAVADGRVAGYLMASLVMESGHINNLACAPAARRTGIGSALLSAFLQKAQAAGVLEVTLEVRKGNRAAISLYEKYGFTPVATRPRFYKNPTEDALLMKKILP